MSIVLEHGYGRVGTIKVVNFTEGIKLKYAKQRVDALDKENFRCKYTAFEEDNKLDILESIVYDVKFEASDNGRCICKSSVEIHFTLDPEIKVREEVDNTKERATALYKLVEAHLLANPDLYA